MFLASSLENTHKEILICLRDNFGKEFGLIGRKGLRVESSRGCRIVANSLQGLDVLTVGSRLNINGVYLFPHVN